MNSWKFWTKEMRKREGYEVLGPIVNDHLLSLLLQPMCSLILHTHDRGGTKANFRAHLFLSFS